MHPIRTRTNGLEGFLELDLRPDGSVNPEVAPKGRLSFAVQRLASGNPLEDRELRRRIDARRYPTIDGELVEIQRIGDGSRYRVRGDLTFRGVTRRVEDEMTLTPVDDRTLLIEGESIFDVRDFGMQPPRILMLRVEPDVKVRVEIAAELDSA